MTFIATNDHDLCLGYECNPYGLLAYYMEKSLEEGADPFHWVGGGVFYTGRENLVLGVEGLTLLRTSSEVDYKVFIGTFRLRYYW